MISAELGIDQAAVLRSQLQLLDLASDAIVVREYLSGSVQFWNRGAEDLYGWSREEALDQSAERLLHTQSSQQLEDIQAELLRASYWEGELRQTTKSGRRVTVASRWALQRDERGAPLAVVEIDSDVTERRQADDELRLRQTITLGIGEAADLDTALGTTLRSICELTGWTLGQAWLPDAKDESLRCADAWYAQAAGLELLHRASRELVLRSGVGLVGRAWASRRPICQADLTCDPRRADIAAQAGMQVAVAVPILAGAEPVAVLEFFASETSDEDQRLLQTVSAVAAQLGTLIRRKRAEAEQTRLLRQVEAAEAKFRRLVETAPDAIVITDSDGRIALTNQQTQALFGYTSDELRGEPVELLLPDSLRVAHADHRARYQAEPRIRPMGAGLELVARRKDGGEFPVEISLSYLHTDDGTLVTSAIRDITERKRTQDELRRSAEELRKSNAELEQFAYVASHDLQEPLRMVSSYTQLLAQRYRGKLDQDADEFIDFAVSGAKRMQALILDLLEYSRVGTRRKSFELTNLNDVFKRVTFDLASTIGETGAVVTCDDLPVVTGDATQLHQVLLNLISNAIRFHGQQLPRVHVTATRQASEWRVSVCDNGIGIDLQYGERIFVLFQRLHNQADYPGTGIGLAICKKVIERHRGRIWVESAIGQGASFHFTLPLILADP